MHSNSAVLSSRLEYIAKLPETTAEQNVSLDPNPVQLFTTGNNCTVLYQNSFWKQFGADVYWSCLETFRSQGSG